MIKIKIKKDKKYKIRSCKTVGADILVQWVYKQSRSKPAATYYCWVLNL